MRCSTPTAWTSYAAAPAPAGEYICPAPAVSHVAPAHTVVRPCSSGAVHRSSASDGLHCTSACGVCRTSSRGCARNELRCACAYSVCTPAPVVECITAAPSVTYVGPALTVYAAPIPAVENIVPVPAVAYTAPVPTVHPAQPQWWSTLPTVYSTPAPVVKNQSSASGEFRSTHTGAIFPGSPVRCTQADFDRTPLEQG